MTNGGTDLMKAPSIERQEFGATHLQSQGETSIAAVTAREQARVQAMFIMAERHPRDWDGVRVRILEHCKRPRFAGIARYKKPVGKKEINGEWKSVYAEGPSARFAETAAQEMTNIATDAPVTYEDDRIRIVRAVVWDVQRNIYHSQEIAVAKAVEKKGIKRKDGSYDPPSGRDVLSSRQNSWGETTYLVIATDDEVRMKQNSELAKIQRNFVMKLLPRDILDEAMDSVLATLADPKKVDPAAEKKRIIDAFATVEVMPEDLRTYLGHGVDHLQPAELDELRALYVAISQGECTFNEAMKAKFGQPVDPDHEETPEQRATRNQRAVDEQTRIAQDKIKRARRTAKPEEQKQPEAPTAELSADVTQRIAQFGRDAAKLENSICDPETRTIEIALEHAKLPATAEAVKIYRDAFLAVMVERQAREAQPA